VESVSSIFDGKDSLMVFLGLRPVFFFFGYLLGRIGRRRGFAAVGAFLGPKLVFCAFIWMALSGGVLALLFVAWKGQTANIRQLKSF
jgi:hypothetical protein